MWGFCLNSVIWGFVAGDIVGGDFVGGDFVGGVFVMWGFCHGFHFNKDPNRHCTLTSPCVLLVQLLFLVSKQAK